ncbi:MAG: hypothetical protein KY476_23285 [Planctomycetes bacterium]|nr:hypothetical protein [Planctomycetota bacterium]
MGEALVEIMQAHPGKRMTVLCGHTHSSGQSQILDNLQVLTGAARYGQPEIRQVISVE